MNVRWKLLLVATGIACSINGAQAQSRARSFVTKNEAIEMDARGVSLPETLDGLMSVTPCSKCAAKSLRATSATVYLLRERAVTLADLRNALAMHPNAAVTVLYSVRTLELVSINASADLTPSGGRP